MKTALFLICVFLFGCSTTQKGVTSKNEYRTSLIQDIEMDKFYLQSESILNNITLRAEGMARDVK
jgi:hypothetical protein